MIKVKKLLLSIKHKRKQYEFTKKYYHQTFDNWFKIIWSDESKYNVFGSDEKEYYWKCIKEPLKNKYVKNTIKFMEKEFLYGNA